MQNQVFTTRHHALPARSSSFKLSFNWLTLSLVALFLFGCKKITEKPGTTGVCPEVIATTPIDTATNTSLNGKVVATFNVVMDSLTITSATFTLREGEKQIPGLVTYTNKAATFSPAANFKANTKYTATITTGVRDPAANAMISDYVWSFTTGDASSIDDVRPTVTSTSPANSDANVVLNKKISATFSEAMDPSSVNNASFVLKQGTTIIPGTVAYASEAVVFSPSASLTAATEYIATITTAAKDLAGNTLEKNYVWVFTTGATSDATPPTVTSTDPVNGANGVATNKQIAATFSELMDPTTINASSYRLMQGSTPIAGSVTYMGATATFSPSSMLMDNTTYTATITTGAKDKAGNALVNNYVWSFTTLDPAPPLGTAAEFGAFGGSAGITNQGLNTRINNGSIGTTGAATLVTGFHDGTTNEVYTETPLNVGYVANRIHAAPPPPGSAASSVIATKALSDANIAYNSISPASKPGGIDPGAGELGGLTLAPGIYKSASGGFNITTGNLTLDAKGNPNAIWIFQASSSLTVGVAGPAGARSVMLINGAQAKNVYWYVGSAATINGAGGGVMTGTIISSAGVTFSTSGNAVQTVLNGRALSLNASVTMVNTTINVQ